MDSRVFERATLGLLSVVVIIAVYTAVAGVYARPDVLPPTGALFAAARSLVTGHVAIPAGEHAHASDHTAGLVEQGVTLQGALLVTFLRAVFGAGVGSVLGILLGLWMGWSRRADHYLHPVYVLSRSVPPLALITYVMLWFGHGQVHLLIPIAYAVAVTAVIPAYHGMLDLGEIHLKAARALGARGWLLWSRVVLPAVTPFVLSGLRYALFVAWMTAVGAEMLMADDGIGHLLVDGGLWSSRLEVRVDPAVVMVGIVGVASVGYAMDLTARVVSGRMTAWMRRGR